MAMTNAERRARYYASNKDKHRAQIRANIERNYQIVREAKSVPCADCGQSYPYWVMDFDHRDLAEKHLNIGRGVRGIGEARLRAEIARCDVVCANCHRLRHPPEQYTNGGCVRPPL